MKLIVLIAVLLTGTYFLVPKKRGISGTWLITKKERNAETAIVRLQLGNGLASAKLDIPAQHVYDKPLSFTVEGDRMKLLLDEQANCFIDVAIGDSIMKGRSVVDGIEQDVILYRLKN